MLKSYTVAVTLSIEAEDETDALVQYHEKVVEGFYERESLSIEIDEELTKDLNK